ncbi:carbon-nitrogen hydrolase [Lasiosphaeria miniovina]|uniref:Carbon-nitrogen hydrolase n=1 Tax=Lasiosphaeria miniovina TaxID=1954250 RepID=A0AA40B6J6_9PEZI|nr:carbon-nitrogen hydrolase [Lasiosphaeria miniovina]KAK0728213.1 carbon-nitrogen hydrolase [Lasiosphaeria miniovina]
MRIGCLQFAPKVGDVSNNLSRADAVLAKADAMELDNLDLLVLPEMAFSGYNFKSAEHIEPFLEPSGSGISALWARTTALKYDCTVAVGYPEKVGSPSPEYYNSLILVNGDGETVANYRKSFLYYTDATWASEGDGFFGGPVGEFGQVAMGICMDINPYKFQAPYHAFEFAFHVLEVRANLVILSMAWLTHEDQATFTPFAQEPDMETLTYWAQRLEPIIRSDNDDEIIVVFCNRCGIEDEVVYAGTSAVLGVKNGEVSVYGLLGRGVKELLVVNTELPPFAKLVNRTETPMRAGFEPSPKSPRRSGKEPSNAPPSRSPALPPASRGQAGGAQAPGSMSRGQVRPKSRAPAAPSSPRPRQPPSLADCETSSEYDEPRDYEVCSGRCGGCKDHPQPAKLGAPKPPTHSRPTPVTQRPKLAISTGPEIIAPFTSKLPPSGMDSGAISSRGDIGTPPVTAFDDFPLSAYYWPSSAHPLSAAVYTPPEDSVWPLYDDTVKVNVEPKTRRAVEQVTPVARPASPKSRNASQTRSPQSPGRGNLWPPGQASPISSSRSRTRTAGPPLPIKSARPKIRAIEKLASPCPTPRSAVSDSTWAQKRDEYLAEAATRKLRQARSVEDLKAKARSKHSITIAASPSVFKTSFSPQEIATKVPARPETRLGHHGLRKSKSIINAAPIYQSQAPPLPRSPLVKTLPFRTAAKAQHPTITITSTSPYPELAVAEDEVYFGHTIPRDRGRRQRGYSNDREAPACYSPTEVRSTISI